LRSSAVPVWPPPRVRAFHVLADGGFEPRDGMLRRQDLAGEFVPAGEELVLR
jgi:hypothetical protein